MRNNTSNAQLKIITFKLRSNFNSSTEPIQHRNRHSTSGRT